jgi:hypothetical protein
MPDRVNKSSNVTGMIYTFSNFLHYENVIVHETRNEMFPEHVLENKTVRVKVLYRYLCICVFKTLSCST